MNFKKTTVVIPILSIVLGLAVLSSPGAQASNNRAFEAASLPVSTTPLGAFPYLALPKGYVVATTPDTSDFDQIPFWTGDRLEAVEGKVWSAHIDAAQGKAFSDLELQRNVESVVSSLGGKKIFDGKIPEEASQRIKEWPRDFAMKYNSGLGDIWNNATQVFVIHRGDRDIWIHLCSYAFGAGMLIAESKPLQITASLLSAQELGAQLEQSGKAVLHVNFASDQSRILPDSQAQLQQVVQLLRQDSVLKLAVNGYTDDTGDAAHNKTLSAQRAEAVVAAIVAQGIDATRLSATGFGESAPVADNASEAGKAQNRRVELVRQD
ncbi:OmpA family protein [Pseudomonas sp. DTU_2021_1001937_2_SI_NGA_ILE_001]|uniref:OmpA family protein n=1 Tax=Pseudomonas sp. DTU_2021_1001937_2_SI_NGA_ILE_001 TaxID=3077589 RepID=UPI0028FC15BF|nr:OmpA family protein [Pseudomonas sp. DTU_2021_1001937_2_SI_NGA_ILE_001]WNW13349.1 OmpA family protein [Pseudomonas sp. DTU_2021_1001937_2_SI_NGA_ILE_001]